MSQSNAGRGLACPGLTWCRHSCASTGPSLTLPPPSRSCPPWTLTSSGRGGVMRRTRSGCSSPSWSRRSKMRNLPAGAGGILSEEWGGRVRMAAWSRGRRSSSRRSRWSCSTRRRRRPVTRALSSFLHPRPPSQPKLFPQVSTLTKIVSPHNTFSVTLNMLFLKQIVVCFGRQGSSLLVSFRSGSKAGWLRGFPVLCCAWRSRSQSCLLLELFFYWDIVLWELILLGPFFLGLFSWVFFLGTPGVSRPVPCMTETVSKLFVASVNFVLWHWDCFVKNLLMGQMKVWF